MISLYSRYTIHHHNSAPSRGGPRSLYSVASSAKTGRSNRSRRAGAHVELMSAPNPFCPNVKGVCCLMLLLNLGLILVTLGFVIVIQFMEPLFVWLVLYQYTMITFEFTFNVFNLGFWVSFSSSLVSPRWSEA